MSPRIALAAALAAALAGCTLADRRTEPVILPEGDLFGGAFLEFEIRASSGARATVFVDGAEVGTAQVNAPESIDASGLAVGRHTLRVKVLEGPYAVEAVERTFEVERTAPRVLVSPGPGELVVPGQLQVSLTFSEPIRVDRLLGASSFVDDQGRTLPATFSATPDGLHATATLGVPLWSRASVRLLPAVVDRAGNQLDPEGSLPIRWSAPATPVEVTVPDYVGDRLEATLAFPPGWTGPTGPVVVLLCPFDPRGVLSRLDSCPSVEIADASQAAGIDTSSIATSYRWIAALFPGHRPSAARMTRVHPSVSVSIAPARRLTNGPVDVTVSATGELPDSMEILAAGEAIGTLVRTGPPGSFGTASTAVTWPAAVPDGDYTLGVRGPSIWRLDRFTTQVTVDRTPPSAVIEDPGVIDTASAWVVRLTVSELVSGTVTRLVNGQPLPPTPVGNVATTTFLPGLSPSEAGMTDAALTVDVSGLTDAAGNHASGVHPAGLFPLWTAPAGAGALEVGGAPLLAREAVATDPGAFGGRGDLRLVLVDQGGQVRAGWLSGLAADPFNGPGTLVPGLASQRDARVSWLETSAGAGEIRSVGLSDSVPFDIPPIAVAAGASTPRTTQGPFPVLTWTEPAAGGATVVRAAEVGGSRVPGSEGLPGTLSEAVEDCCFFRGGVGHVALAAIDGASGVPQLTMSASRIDPASGAHEPWTTLVTSANADPSQPASEPDLFGRWVGWNEAGAIRAARIDAAGTGLQVDHPASAAGARWPRFLAWTGQDAATLLLFVEPGTAGDVIAVRRWSEGGGGWVALPPVNAGVAGEVRSLAVSLQHVTWTDAAGHVYARRLNR